MGRKVSDSKASLRTGRRRRRPEKVTIGAAAVIDRSRGHAELIVSFFGTPTRFVHLSDMMSLHVLDSEQPDSQLSRAGSASRFTQRHVGPKRPPARPMPRQRFDDARDLMLQNVP